MIHTRYWRVASRAAADALYDRAIVLRDAEARVDPVSRLDLRRERHRLVDEAVRLERAAEARK